MERKLTARNRKMPVQSNQQLEGAMPDQILRNRRRLEAIGGDGCGRFMRWPIAPSCGMFRSPLVVALRKVGPAKRLTQEPEGPIHGIEGVFRGLIPFPSSIV